jgi:hypothetical protein
LGGVIAPLRALVVKVILKGSFNPTVVLEQLAVRVAFCPKATP